MNGGIGNLMKQAQQLQANMQKAQEEIAAMEVTGESGGGMVKVTINGRHEAKRVQIDPSVPLDDREMVEDLVAAAINDEGTEAFYAALDSGAGGIFTGDKPANDTIAKATPQNTKRVFMPLAAFSPSQ